MVRILGHNVNDLYQIIPGLSSLPGVGTKWAFRICNHLGLHSSTRFHQLSPSHLLEIRRIVEPLLSSFSLQRSSIRHLIAIHSRRGFRHFKHLPVRGQRTRSNARTVKRVS